jgi:hypothetical protein
MPSALVDNDFFVDFDEPSSMYDSDGKPLSQSQIAFFNRSKCLDEDGSLLVVYHASPNKFSSFDPKLIGSGGGSIYGKGFYFCDNTYDLDQYGKYINAYYLNLINPFRWEACEEDADKTYNLDMFIEVLEKNNFKVTEEQLAELEEDLLDNDGGLDTVIELTCGSGFAQKYFEKAGYDGIMNLDSGDHVAFYPEQIKLCSNKTPAKSADITA